MEMARLTNLIAFIICQLLLCNLASAQGANESSPITEFELPESLSASFAIDMDRDGRIWFTEKVGRNLAMFDPDGEQFAVYPLPDSWGRVGPSQLTVTGGDVWFTIRRWADDVTQTNVLGKFSTSTGAYVRYEISLDASPQEIVADDKGMLWLLAADSNQLFRVDPVNGKVLSYEIPTPNSNPQGLSVGLNGDIWFSEPNANQIGRFSSGFFEEYKVPTAFSNPGDTAVDDQGNIWFAQRAANRLGVLYPELNRFDEALVPTIGALPHAIELDDDGRVWFLEYRGNKVGVFNPTLARFDEFEIPRYNTFPGEMVFDPKRGALWFTESNAEITQLGKLSINLANLPAISTVTKGGETRIATRTATGGAQVEYSTLYTALSLAALLFVAGVWVALRQREVG
ncbi:MAG: hypothetical protein CMQ19_08530 [Gammaproteobacteria bacterium]|nr:hypothetical protein [Gammaproteobacteria bacterium]